MSEMIKSDKELIESYLNGNLSDFSFLVDRYQSKIYSYIVMLVKDRQLADDLFQDTFLKIIRTIKAGGYAEEGKFINFAMRIARNLVIDYFRKSSKYRMIDTEKEDFNLLDNMNDYEPSVEERMIKEQIYADLRKMVELLPCEQREVLQMRIYAEMSFKDIADVTNVSINTALGRMRYAVTNLRKMIAEKDIKITV